MAITVASTGLSLVTLVCRAELPDAAYLEIETYADAQPMLREGINRAERFLGLVALLSLLVGGIGVAQTVRAWIAGRMDSIAVLKCLGVRPREVVALYLGQTMLLGLMGSLLGVAAGVPAVWVLADAAGCWLYCVPTLFLLRAIRNVRQSQSP